MWPFIWTRIDLRNKQTLPTLDTYHLLYIDKVGFVVGKIVGDVWWERSTKGTHYIYHNFHKPLKGHKVWWMPLPAVPPELKV